MNDRSVLTSMFWGITFAISAGLGFWQAFRGSLSWVFLSNAIPIFMIAFGLIVLLSAQPKK